MARPGTLWTIYLYIPELDRVLTGFAGATNTDKIQKRPGGRHRQCGTLETTLLEMEPELKSRSRIPEPDLVLTGLAGATNTEKIRGMSPSMWHPRTTLLEMEPESKSRSRNWIPDLCTHRLRRFYEYRQDTEKIRRRHRRCGTLERPCWKRHRRCVVLSRACWRRHHLCGLPGRCWSRHRQCGDPGRPVIVMSPPVWHPWRNVCTANVFVSLNYDDCTCDVTA